MTVFSGTSADNVFTIAAGNNRYDALGGDDTAIFSFKLTDATITYTSDNEVIVDTATSHTLLTGFQKYQFTDGTVDESDGSSLVADLFYYAQNHDVWAAGIDADAHYNTVGWKEGRDPNPFFDTDFYLTANPDVAAAGINPLSHFHTVGWAEGRDPSSNFSVQTYLAQNPAVAAAHVDPLQHFLQTAGEPQSSSSSALASATTGITSTGFDNAFYLAQNPDVAASGMDPYFHFQTAGWKEGRNPNAYFDVQGYLAENPDVAASGINPLDHFHAVGFKEGRNPSPWFDLSKYFAANPDIQAANVDPVWHFLTTGQAEGRQAIDDDVTDRNATADAVVENASTGVDTGVRASWGAWAGVTYTITGDTSGGGFAVNASTGVVTVANGALIDFETAPGQAYFVTVQGTKNGQSNTQQFKIVVADSGSDVPVFSSGTTESVAENTSAATVVYDANASHPGPLTYSIVGGADAALFNINSSTGQVRFNTSPNFEAPADNGGNNVYDIIVRAANGPNFTDQSVAITVTDVAENAAPTAVNLINTTISIAENTAVGTGIHVANVAVTDDGFGTNVLSLSGTDAASFELRGNALYYIGASPNFEVKSSYLVNVNVDDSSIGGPVDATSSFTLNISNVNEAPVADADGPYSVAEDGSLSVNAANGVLAGDTDVDAGASLTAALVSGPAHAGSFTLNTDGSFNYTPAANFSGSDTFVYRTSDGTLFSDPIVVTINVTAQNDTPVTASASSFSGAEDVVYNGQLPSATDAEGSALTYALFGAPNNGSVVINPNGTFTFTPTANFSGNATFQYVANDGTVDSAPQTVTINFAAVNDAPVADADGPYAVAEDGSLSVNAAGGVLAGDIDIEGSGLIATLLAGPAHATSFTLNTDGSFTYTPAANFTGSDTFTYRAFDGTAFSDPMVVTINVTAQNDAPVGTAATFTINEDTPLAGSVSATDTEGSSLTYALVAGSATNGSATVNTDGTFTFTPTANFSGTATFQFTANDGTTGSAPQTVTINVTAVNDVPVATADSLSATQDGTAAIGNLLTNDTDIEDGSPIPGNITSFAVAGVGAGTVGTPLALGNGASLTVAANGVVTLTQNNAYDGLGAGDTTQISLTYTVTDSGGATDTSSAVITVSGVNDPILSPATTTADVTEDLDTQAHGNVFDDVTDLDIGDNHTVTAVVTGATPGAGGVGGSGVLGTYGTLTIDTNGEAHYELNNSLPAVQALNTGSTPLTDTFTYTVSDGLTSASTTITFSVHGTNDGPVARPDFTTVTEDSAVALNVLTNNDTDVDTGDTLSVVSFNIGGGPVTAGTFVGVGPGGVAQLTVLSTGEVVLNQNGAFEFLRQGETRAVSFSYTMQDAAGATDVASVTLTVTGANDAPTLDLNTATAGEDFATTATSGDLNTAISGNTAITDGLADAEGRIKVITLNLSAVSGVTDGGEGLHLPAGYEAVLESLGIATVTGDGSTTLTITATTSFSPDQAEAIIEQIGHANPDTTFNFNPEDRSITVTVTDLNANANPNASDTQTTTIDMAANVVDTTNVGTFVGANRDDTIQGAAGDDTMEGRGGDDTIWGGTTAGDLAGTDIAVFSGNVGEYTITRNSSSFYTVEDNTAARDGTDSVHDAEILRFDDADVVVGAPILVLNDDGTQLLATFDADELDLAVNYANSHAGANQIELKGVSGPFTAGTWPVTITEAVTIKSIGGTATINAGANSGISVAASAVLGGADTVRLEGLNITGNGAANDTVGVLFSGAYDGPSDGAIQIVNTSVSGFGQNGIAIIGGGAGLSVTIDGDHPATGVTTETATITGSGGNSTGAGGSGDILFFEFTGAAALKNLVVTGTTGTSAASADNGIQIAGFDDGDDSIDHAIGAVTFQNVAVNGTYEKTLVYIQGYNNLSALGFAGGLALGNGGSAATWAALYIEPQSTNGTFTVDPTSSLNLTGVDVTAGTYGTNPAFAATYGGRPIVAIGTPGADTITGTGEDEGYLGAAGNDIINAGGGSDIVLQGPGGGSDTVNGGTGSDVLSVLNVVPSGSSFVPNPAATTITISDTELNTIDNSTATTDVSITVDVSGGPTLDSSVTMDNVEDIQIVLGSGGDTVTIGDLTGTAVETTTITVVGGAGNDTVDAGAIAATQPINVVFTTIGGSGNGDDKLVSGAGNDTFQGGTGGSDTLDLSQATSSVVASTGTGSVSATGIGSDNYSGVENLTGGSAGDQLTGDSGANVLVGSAGDDTLVGGTGSDTLIGGTDAADTSSNDQATINASLTVADFSYNTGTGRWTVTSADGTDTLEGVEFVNHNGGQILLVDPNTAGGFSSIQAAIDAASTNDVILVAPGTYIENITVTKSDITLLSVGGRGATFIQPLDTTLDAINFAPGVDNVTIGNVGLSVGHPGYGFTITGGDGPAGIERAAVYLSGGNDNVTIRGNDLVANGDSALTTTGVTTTLIIDQNIISGKTFTGTGPAGGPGFANQFIDANYPRQLVVVQGSSTGTEFTNNLVTGTAGGISTTTSNPFGNTLVTIDSPNSTVSNNTFTGYTTQDNANGFFAHSLRIGGTGQTVTGNVVNNDTLGSASNGITLRNGATGTFTGNQFIGSNTATDIVFTTGNTALNAMTPGADTVTGNGGADFLAAGAGDDTINGGAGADTLHGQAGADTLNGGTEGDSIYGGAGDDVAVDGGAGDDTIYFYKSDGNDKVLGGAGTDDAVVVKNATFGFTGDTLLGGPVTFTVGAVASTIGDPADDILVQVGDGTGPGVQAHGSILMDQVEDISIVMGTGGDTVDITTPLGGTSLSISTITVTGGTGADKVNAGAMTSDHSIVFNGGAGNDEFVTGGGDDTYDGGANTDTVSFASSAEGISVALNESDAATVTHVGDANESDSVKNVENVVGSTHADTITGDDNDNVITANGGDDVLAGGAGTDAVIVTGAMSTYTVTVAPNGTITLNDGTDQIQVAADVENLTFGGGSGGTIDLTNTVRVLDDLGHLVATYDTITEAVDAATTLAGYTVQILGKAGAGPDYTEAVNVTKALSFVGVDVGNGLPTITSAGATFNLTGALGAGAVSFANLHISGGTFGILAGETLSSLGTLNATNVHISGTATGAIAVMGDDTLATVISPVANVSVTNSTFTNNGDGSSGGDGDLLFFGYSGNATLSGLTLTGDAAFTGGDPAAFANYTGPRTGIQFRADTGSIGNVSINGVTINGAYSHQAIGIFNYDSLDNLTIGTTTAVTVNADSLRFNTSINIDGITDDVNYSNASQFGTINTPTDRVSLQGDGAAQTITGDNDGEFIRGRDGADTLIGNGGDDLIVGDDGNAANQTNSGNDQMTGGGGNDTLVGEAGFDQANFIATELTAGMFSVATDADPLTLGDQAGWTITTGGSEGTDTVTGVEIVQGTDPAGPATGRFLLVGNGGYATIQDAIDAATAGDTVLVAPGTYNGNVALKSGVSLVGKGATQDDVLINGTMSTPASFADATVSMLKVQNVGNGMLLDMKGTSSITDAVFDHITFSLTSDFVGEVPIGNGQVAGSIAINDGADAGTAGLTFQHVVMASNNHNFPSSVAFVYTTIHSVGLAKMVLNDVTLSGTASGTTGGLGAQWNMTPNTGETARVDIVNSHTSGGGNFYVSGFDGVTIQDNIFDGQGLALNGVKNGSVIGNTFQNIDGTIWANEAAFNAVTNQHRGLVVEDAWGTSGVSNLSIHGNTFQNITAADGAIAFQRFNSTPSNTASLDRLNDVEVYDNTFTTVADNVYLNPTFFNADAVLQAPFAGNQLIIGTSGVDTITDPSALSDGATTIVGGPGADTINAGGGNDTIIWRAGDGSDDIDGGTDATGDDTLLVASNGSNITIDGDGTANPAEFTVSDGVGAAVVAEIEEVEVSLSSGNTLTVMGDFDGTGVNLSTITVTGTAGNETVNASAMSGAGAGSPVGIEFTGNGGDDTFHSGIGNDTFHGGTGSDTAVYQTAYSNNVTFDGTTATVTGARGTDTYDGVGTITFTDKTVWLVSKDAGSEYTEIAQLFDGNAANGEAAAGDVVLVSAGSYAGGFSIGVNNVTIKGAEAGVEIVGTFKSTNAISGSVADFLKTATSYTTTGDRGITVGADNVTIENLKVDGAYVGVELGNGVDHVTIKDVTIEDSVNGIRKGTGAQVTDLDLIGGEIRDSYIGMYLAKETADGLDISDVLIQGTKFTNLTEKGIYAESLANANITGIIMNNVGEYGRGASFGTAGQFGNGIDLNLKWDYETTTDIVDDAAPYSGITIQNFTFTNVGSSDKDGTAPSHAGGAAIAVKARDQGSYASPEQASFSGAVVIQNGTINGTSVAVRAGEPNQNIADPDVTITNVTVSGEGFDVDNVTQSPMTVNMVDGGDTLTAATPTTGTLIVNGGTGSDTVTTGAGNDTLKGNGGGDALDGAVGTDTAAYTQGITAAMITQSGGGWQVATGGGEGTDTLSNIEIIDGGEAGKILLVGNGGYATIQAAIDAASAGDTIVVASGTYDEDLVIDEAVTIVGAKRGVSGTGAGRDAAIGAGETTIIGRAHVTALGAVTIDGMRFLNDATTTNGGPGNPTLQLASGYDHVVTNSIFYSSVAGGVRPSPDDRAISTPVLADGDITISNNYFTGAFTGLFGGTPPASWGRAVWFDGGNDVNLTVTGNTIEYSRTGLNLDLTGTATATVNDNTFRSDGTAIAVGVDTDGLTVTNNDVQNVGDEFNFRNITSGVTFDADVAIDTLTPAVPANPGNDAVFVLGGQGNDNLSGTEGVDVIDGNNLNSVADTDTLTGRGGDDILLGRAGNDSLDGGADNDLLDGGTGTDTMSGGTGNDTYLVDNAGDVLIEATGAGTDTVNTTVSYTLGAGVEVENLTLADLATRTETFENFTLGPISDGENGWKFVGGPKDQEVILDGANKVFRMSSDPSVGDFSGPYSPSLPLSAGEPGTSAAGDSHVISFDFRAVQLNDFSRLELDLGNASGTDRNSFMVIENTASGIRIAVADALPDGNFDTGPDLNNFTPYTGNRELVSGVNAGAAHTLSMVARYVAGANNDVVDIYLDGSLIGTTTTFENFHDAQPGNPGHLANAEANLTNRLFFRGGGTVVNDGAGAGQNQGFLFDNIQNAVFNSGQSLTGNEFAQTITGNAGDNTLIGLGANDAIVGGLGRDTAVYTQTITAAMITQSGGGWQVAAGGAEATDTLTGVEVVQGADPDGAGVATGKFLLVGNGGYASIAAAYGAAVDGDTIVIASGTYTENLTIDKEITIVGANRGIAGDGSRGAESEIVGGLHITSSNVTVDGVKITDGRVDYGYQRSGVFIDGAQDNITIKNSIIDQPNAHGESFQHGIITTYNAATGNLQVLDNLISHWNEGMYLNPGVHDATFSGNAFADNGNHIVSDAIDDFTVTNNDFGDSEGSKIFVNVYDNPTDLQSELGLAGNTFALDGKAPLSIAPLGADGQVVLGTSIGDRFRGDFAGNPTQTFEGRGGDDSLIGGAGTDTARYGVDVTATDISAVSDADPYVAGNQAGWQVAAGSEGTDLLVGMEIVDDATGGKYLLVGNGGFATIQDALTAASDGDTILIAAGTWSGAGNAGLTVDKTVTFIGMGATIDASGFSYGFDVNMATDKLAGTVTFKNLTIDNAASSGINSRDQQVLGTLTLDGVTITDSGSNGFYASGRKASTAYAQAGVQNVNILNSTFTNNGLSAINAANIMLFEFDGNATITNVTASNSIAGGAFGIQIAGFDSGFYDQLTPNSGYPGVGSYDVLTAMGTVALDQVNITGTYLKPGFYVQGYTDTTGLTITSSTVNVDSTSWDKPVIIDPMADQLPTGTPGTAANPGSFFDETSANGSYNLSGLNVTQQGTQLSELDGTTKADTIVGTNAIDQITGFGGADNLSGGAGNDVFIIAAGTDHAAGESINGGADTDVIRFTSTTAGDTLTLTANVAAVETVVISDAAGVTTGTTALNVNASAVTGVISLTGNDGDNVLTGNGSANTIIGGGGIDTIDAGGGIDTVSAGNGNDIVVGTADGVSDVYDGGTGTDTIDYSALTIGQSISVNLGTGGASGSAIGSDNLSGSSFENVNAGGGNDSLFGSLANNVIHGGAGSDNIVGDAGSDTLFGEADNDTLNGGTNDFVLTPGAANDVLWGGLGTDTFRFEGRFGDDTIGAVGTPDWTDGEDLVFVGYSAASPIIVDTANGALITINDGFVASSVLVAGATAAQMSVVVSGSDLIIH